MAKKPDLRRFVPALWEGKGGESLMAVANYQPNQAQCSVRLSAGDLAGCSHELTDLLGPAQYRDELVGRGLYLDVPPWGFHLFRIQAVG
jgi:hypothetical protein